MRRYNVNDNVNGSFKTSITMNNVNDNVREGKYDKAKQVEVVADTLLERLGAKVESRPFMCKVAWKLPEHRVWTNVETALKGNNPVGLFIYLCKRDGV